MAKINGKNIGDLPGTMKHFGGGSVPSYYLLCDGTAISRTTYKALFAAVGTNFGVGDGSTTFNLPDSRRQTLIGAGGSQTSGPGTSVGNQGGEEVHTLALTETPSHNHGSASFASTTHKHTTTVAREVGTDFAVSGNAFGQGSGPGSMGSGVGFTVGQQGADSVQSNTYAKTDTADGTTALASAGGGSSHNNMQPSLVVTMMIKT